MCELLHEALVVKFTASGGEYNVRIIGGSNEGIVWSWGRKKSY